MTTGRGWLVALGIADAAVLVGAWPRATEFARKGGDLAAWLRREDVDVVVAAMAAAGLWLAAAWLALGLLAAVASALPGAAGRAAGHLARLTLPPMIRRVVAGSAGLGMLLAPVVTTGAGAATPSDGPGGRPTVSAAPLPGPAWPGDAAPRPTAAHNPPSHSPAPHSPAPPTTGASLPPGPSWPGSPPATPPTTADSTPTRPHTTAPGTAPSPGSRTMPGSGAAPQPASPREPGSSATPGPKSTTPVPASPRPADRVADDTVTVRPGDCLWLLAAGRVHGAAATGEYARELYETNRQVVGADPDLLRPGQVLSLPAPHPTSRESS